MAALGPVPGLLVPRDPSGKTFLVYAGMKDLKLHKLFKNG